MNYETGSLRLLRFVKSPKGALCLVVFQRHLLVSINHQGIVGTVDTKVAAAVATFNIRDNKWIQKNKIRYRLAVPPKLLKIVWYPLMFLSSDR